MAKRLLDFQSKNNAPVHNALSVRKFLAENRTPVLRHIPYSLDFAPCNFCLFSKLKIALKGTHFEPQLKL